MLLIPILLCILSFAQNSSKIEGSYNFERGSLIINADNTCFILAENTFIKGVVEIEDSIVTIKPYVPEVPFVIYGRKNNNYREARAGEKGVMNNKIMFQNFGKIEALVNFDAKNSSLQKMTPVLNADANCVDSQLVLDNEKHNEKFYFAIKGLEEVYEFDNDKGYSDFIVQYIVPETEQFEIVLNWNKKTNKLTLDGEVLERLEKAMSKEAMTNFIGIYNRVFPEAEYYYCNSAYNFFEENGIDVHSEQYKKVENYGEYYYIDKLNGPPMIHEIEDSGDFIEIDKAAEYKDTYQIFEYKKVKPTILKNKSYTIDKSSVFNFKCEVGLDF